MQLRTYNLLARLAYLSVRGFGGLDHLLFPPHCIVCNTPVCRSDERLCPACWQELSRNVAGDYCRRCGRNASPHGIVNNRCGACQDEEFAFDGIIRAGIYETALRNLVLSFKFHQKSEYAKRIGQMMQDALTVSGLNRNLDIFVPVPLHWRRHLERGYNQSLYLARGLRGGSASVSTDLVRTRYTRRQWSLTDTQRRRNVKGAFAVRRGHPFSGKTIGLVDDITTSGATLNECAKALKDAGAVHVYAVVAAVANPTPP